MSIFRSSRWATVLVAATLLASACGDDEKEATTGGTSPSGTETTDAAPGSLVLAFVGAQTGDNANLGINISNAVQLALDEANAKGDLPVKVSLKTFDTQGTPEQAALLKDKVVADGSVVGIIGPAFSGESKAALPTFDQAGIPVITPSATNPTLSEQGWKVFHRLLANDTAQGTETANYISKGLKATSVAYIHDNSEYGKGLVDVVKAQGDKLKIKAAVFDAIDPKGTDYSAAVNKVKASKAPVIYYAGYYSEAGKLAKQLRDAGVTATFLSGDGSKDPGFIAAAGAPAAEAAELTCPCADPAVATDPASVAFTAAYTKKFNKAPGTYSAEGYDTANIFVAAVKAGNTTRETILKYLNEGFPGHKGITKDVAFTPTGEPTTGAVYVYTVKDGKITVKGTTTELAK